MKEGMDQFPKTAANDNEPREKYVVSGKVPGIEIPDLEPGIRIGILDAYERVKASGELSHLWKKAKLLDTEARVRTFVLVDAVRAVNESSEKEWLENPTYYYALLKRIEHLRTLEGQEGE